MGLFNVLVVEDNLIFRQALTDILKSQFPCMAIEEANDGPEALQKIDTLLPSIVFMDIKLPGENGLDVTQKIKAQHPETIIIMLTSYDLPEYRDAAFRYGANHFIVKGSSTFEEISSLIKSVISSQKLSSPCNS
jgi:DNA-binding NarL/FixJ family response regulator